MANPHTVVHLLLLWLTKDINQPRQSSYGALHLLWLMPLIFGTSFVLFIYAQISKCGISGCSGGGFGVTSDPVGIFLAVSAAGLIAGASLLFVPWSFRLLRAFVAAATSLTIWIIMSIVVFR